MKKILTIIGARPQFIKSCMVSKALKNYLSLTEYTLHTGQHFEENVSDIFFKQLQLPQPYKHLRGANQGKLGAQLAYMIQEIESSCMELSPHLLMVYGDTTSTLAGALAARHLDIPIAHVEAGLRSYNKAMPEENNRTLTDHISSLLFVPHIAAAKNLEKENITRGVHIVGDVMIDLLHWAKANVIPKTILPPGLAAIQTYGVMTLHRKENTLTPEKLLTVFAALERAPYPFIFPLHPRTRNFIQTHTIKIPEKVIACEPLGYFEMLKLVANAQVVWTDSGGLQKEAVILGKKCFTLRPETEWVETLTDGWNQLLPIETTALTKALDASNLVPKKPFDTGYYYGDGDASVKISSTIEKTLLQLS